MVSNGTHIYHVISVLFMCMRTCLYGINIEYTKAEYGYDCGVFTYMVSQIYTCYSID